MPGPDPTSPLETERNDPDINESRCARCGASFHCGMNDAGKPCWCAAFPRVMPVPRETAGCYCPACLAELTAAPVQRT